MLICELWILCEDIMMAFMIRPVMNFAALDEEMEGSGMLLSDMLLDLPPRVTTVPYWPRITVTNHRNLMIHLSATQSPSATGNNTHARWYSDDFLTASAWTVVKVALLLTLAISAITGNVIVILSQVSRPKQTAKLASENIYQHIISLSLVAVFTGIFAIFYIVLDMSDTFWGVKYVCLSYHSFLTFVQIANQGGLLLALLDCSAALAYPLRYPFIMLRKRLNIGLTLLWLYAIGLSILPMICFNQWGERILAAALSCERERVLKRTYTVFMFVHFILIGVADIVLYVSVCFEVWRKKALDTAVRLRHSQRQKFEEKHRRAGQHAVTVILSSFLYLLLWGPYIALSLLHVMGGRTGLTSFIEEILLILALLQCSINPAILFTSLKPLRYGYRRLGCCGDLCTKLIRGVEERSGVRLNSMSFRSRVTGSLLNLHTALDGRAIRLPHVIVTDAGTRGHKVSAPMPHHDPLDSVWYTAGSSSSGVYSLEPERSRAGNEYVLHTRGHCGESETEDSYPYIPPPDY